MIGRDSMLGATSALDGEVYMSDPLAASLMRAAAARHFEQAIELEKGPTVSDRVADVKS